jgi:hypothetical protein
MIPMHIDHIPQDQVHNTLYPWALSFLAADGLHQIAGRAILHRP